VVGGAGRSGPFDAGHFRAGWSHDGPGGHLQPHHRAQHDGRQAYNPWEAFDVIGQVAALRYGVGVGANSPIKTLEELIATGKQRLVTYGSNNVTNVVAMFQLAKLTGARFRWVVFSGAASNRSPQAVGGHVDAVIQTVAEMRPQIDGGKLRLLAAAGPERWPDYPNIKTLRENGYEATTNGPFGYAFPAGVEPSIRQRMEAALADVMADKGVQTQIANLGIVPVYRNGKPTTRHS
jgi:tripartite-type tricarboxylate transporter receptor subunit TctC